MQIHALSCLILCSHVLSSAVIRNISVDPENDAMIVQVRVPCAP
jgi:hypothetical protein